MILGSRPSCANYEAAKATTDSHSLHDAQADWRTGSDLRVGASIHRFCLPSWGCGW